MKAMSFLPVLTLFAFTIASNAQVLNWTNKANIPQQYHSGGGRSFGVAQTGGKIYLVGGLNHPNPSTAVLAYDPATDAWQVKAPLLSPRYAPAAVALNGKVFAIGGTTNGSGSGISATMEEYDPISDSWTNRPSMNQIRYACAATTFNGKIYVFGGQTTGDVALESVEEFDPVSNSWSFKTAMPIARVSFGVIALGSKIYVFGGRSGNQPRPEVFAFDPALNSWSTNANMPTPRETLGAVVANDRILALGGQNLSGATSVVEEFDPISNRWQWRFNLPTSDRSECFATMLNDALFVFGGYDVWTMQSTRVGLILDAFTAVELGFKTKIGWEYQIQASLDLTTWTNVGATITGDGNYWSDTYSTRNQSKLHFRLNVLP